MSAPLLIALPMGLIVSGVATWAVRLCNVLAQRGRTVGLIVHAPPIGRTVLDLRLDPRVRVTDLTRLPPLETAAGELAMYREGYQRAVRELAGDGPVVVFPNLLGDCYALAAELVRSDATSVRLVGWLHSDIAYEYHVQKHFEPAISLFVPVSTTLEHRARVELAGRGADIVRIPYGVEIAPGIKPRPPLEGRAVRMVYAGRLDQTQKRVLALVAMSDELSSREVAHELLIIGDGPLTAELAGAVVGKRAILRLGAKSLAQVLAVLDSADIAVLASRYEGLSVAMIEAMSRGCVPVMARTASGAAELVDDGVQGLLVEADADGPDTLAGIALAESIIRAIPDLPGLSERAHARALERYSLGTHADAVEALLDRAAAEPPREWPQGRACAFSGEGNGSLPPDGKERMIKVLGSLSGQRVVIHGTGRHTEELQEVIQANIAGDPAGCVVAFADDDATKRGGSLWGVPIIAPEAAGGLGATDVVISSWINREAIWSRRALYESRGVRVHRLYE